MGAALPKGGPAGLFLGFVVYGTMMLSVNQCFGAYDILLFLVMYYFGSFCMLTSPIFLQRKWSLICQSLRRLFG